MTLVTIEHGQIPKSANASIYRTHHQQSQRTKKEWQGTFGYLLMAAKLPRGLEKVTATVELKFRVRRTRDADNFYLPISKPLGDALTAGGWIPDDSPDHYAMERVRISDQKVPHDTMVIHLEFEDPA
jgi:hypothetical protein